MPFQTCSQTPAPTFINLLAAPPAANATLRLARLLLDLLVELTDRF